MLGGQPSIHAKNEYSGMIMLCWMCGHTNNDVIKNEDIRNKVGVAIIEDKMRENCSK